MLDAFLNSQLFAVVIGIVLTTLSAWLGQLMMIKKEETLFDKQQAAKEKKWLWNEQKTESKNIQEIYRNAFTALSTFIASERARGYESSDHISDRDVEIQDVIDCLSPIVLRFPSHNELIHLLEMFPEGAIHCADGIRDILKDLIKREEDLFLTKPKKLSETEQKNSDPNSRVLKFKVTDGFRRSLILKGIEIDKNHSLDVKLSDFTESQRELLNKIYFDRYKKIPEILTLSLPKYPQNGNKIIIDRESWEAELNPKKTEISEILSTWEKDFNRALKVAENQKKKAKP